MFSLKNHITACNSHFARFFNDEILLPRHRKSISGGWTLLQPPLHANWPSALTCIVFAIIRWKISGALFLLSAVTTFVLYGRSFWQLMVSGYNIYFENNLFIFIYSCFYKRPKYFLDKPTLLFFNLPEYPLQT